jgi:hypothetical protein
VQPSIGAAAPIESAPASVLLVTALVSDPASRVLSASRGSQQARSPPVQSV